MAVFQIVDFSDYSANGNEFQTKAFYAACIDRYDGSGIYGIGVTSLPSACD
jgi:hypothetical protein